MTTPEKRPSSTPQSVTFVARDDVADMARTFSLWLNSTYPPDLDYEAHMRRRVTKVCEEAGEVHEAVGAFWQENPRKPAGTLNDVIKELADCAGAALGAIEHLTGHQGFSLDIVTERVREVCVRVGITVEKGSSRPSPAEQRETLAQLANEAQEWGMYDQPIDTPKDH